jgi:hypothetical protein
MLESRDFTLNSPPELLDITIAIKYISHSLPSYGRILTTKSRGYQSPSLSLDIGRTNGVDGRALIE